MNIKEVTYIADMAQLFSYFAEDDWSVFLDSSCQKNPEQARYDIIGFDPIATIQTKASDKSNAFEAIRKYLKPTPNPFNLPFTGGAIGYFSYELMHKQLFIDEKVCSIPKMQVGIYDKAIITDHLKQQSFYINHRDKQSLAELLNQYSDKTSTEAKPFKLLKPFSQHVTFEEYQQAFTVIQKHLRAGDCYQVNYTQAFSAEFTGSLWPIYSTIRSKMQAPYSAFLNFPITSILSFSPEQFIGCQNSHAMTKPIKGTIARLIDQPKLDQQQKQVLQENLKERAENVMIVDLLRNDFGRICVPGSIQVTKLFDVESFAHVHHLVSQVDGKLPDDKHAIDLLAACFPGGSITGTPKLRAMQIIAELEKTPRSIYCGSIGYIDYNGNMNTNIAIRTVYSNQDNLICSAGGAIVADSELNSEYQECFDKISALMQFFEQL